MQKFVVLINTCETPVLHNWHSCYVRRPLAKIVKETFASMHSQALECFEDQP